MERTAPLYVNIGRCTLSAMAMWHAHRRDEYEHIQLLSVSMAAKTVRVTWNTVFHYGSPFRRPAMLVEYLHRGVLKSSLKKNF